MRLLEVQLKLFMQRTASMLDFPAKLPSLAMLLKAEQPGQARGMSDNHAGKIHR